MIRRMNESGRLPPSIIIGQREIAMKSWLPQTTSLITQSQASRATRTFAIPRKTQSEMQTRSPTSHRVAQNCFSELANQGFPFSPVGLKPRETTANQASFQVVATPTSTRWSLIRSLRFIGNLLRNFSISSKRTASTLNRDGLARTRGARERVGSAATFLCRSASRKEDARVAWEGAPELNAVAVVLERLSLINHLHRVTRR